MKKNFFGILIMLFTIILCTSCGAKNNFEEYEITEKGVLKWNKIKEAKYYYISIGGDEFWTEKPQYEISKYIEEKEETYVEITPFSSKSIMGVLEVEELYIKVIKYDGVVKEIDKLDTYTVNYVYMIDGKESKALSSKSVTSYKAYISPTATGTNTNYYDILGSYSDKECTKKISEEEGIYIYPKEDTTIYIKATTKKGKLEVYKYVNKVKTLYKTISYKYGESISFSIPEVTGYTFNKISTGTGWFSSTVKLPVTYATESATLYIIYDAIE